jgi:fructose-1-phosphate kinase PfkB-like protein
MTTTDAPTGISAGGKPINLSQLQAELQAEGVARDGLGMHNGWIFPYDETGVPSDFTPQETPIVQTTINAHVAMRDKTTEEYSVEFQDPDTTPVRKQEIRDITAGLLPSEQVPMEAA